MNKPVKNRLLCLVSGACLTLAFAPFDIFIAVIVAFIVFMYCIRNSKTQWDAFVNGYIFSFSHLLTSCYWVAFSVTKALPGLWWLTPFAMLVVPLLFGFVGALTAALSYHFRRNNIIFITVFAFSYVLFDNIRTLPGIEFPWNFIAYSLSGQGPLLQFAYYMPTNMLSALILYFCGLIYINTPISWGCALIIALTVSATGFYHYENSAEVEFEPDITLRLVQPNITELHYGHPDYMKMVYDQLMETAIATKATHINKANKVNKLVVIMPEASIPYTLKEAALPRHHLLKDLPKNSVIIAGVDRWDPTTKNYYNSLLMYDNSTSQGRFYDKERLVPYGEYIPLRSFLPFVSKIAQGMGDFTAGENQSHVVEFANLPSFRPLICYEVVFPQILDESEQPKWLLAITNDFWFDDSLGPHQHFAIARYKAVEAGLPLVRVANNGITAVVDNYGNILYKAPQFNKIVADFNLPKAEQHPKNSYFSYIFLLCALSAVVFQLGGKFFYQYLKKVVHFFN